MKKPIIYSVNADGTDAPVFSQGNYDVLVGALDADKLPVYVIRNRTTDVVEFTTEVTGIYKDWLNHFAVTVLETSTPVDKTTSDQLTLALNS